MLTGTRWGRIEILQLHFNGDSTVAKLTRLPKRVVETATNAVARAERRLVRKLQNPERYGRVSGEEDFTSRFAEAIEIEFGHIKDFGSGVVIKVQRLTSQRVNSEESKFGADFLISLTSTHPKFSIQKGVLVQAKLTRNWKRQRNLEASDLIRQCKEMQRHSRRSIVMVYSERGIKVSSAASLLGSAISHPVQIAAVSKRGRPPSSKAFFRRFFSCKAGDPRLPPEISAMMRLTIQPAADPQIRRRKNRLPVLAFNIESLKGSS